MFSLENKNVLVAGGAGYLGTPVCVLLKQLGANVCIADRDPDALAKAVPTVESTDGPGKTIGLHIDMSDEASILSCVDQCAAELGGLWGLVVATAKGSGKTFDELTSEEFDLANRINLTADFIISRAASKHMKDGGSIVLYSSMFGVVSPNPSNYPGAMPPNPIEYGAGKAGINQMARYMAGHFGPQNIRVNSVCPGPFPHQGVQDQHPDFMVNLRADTMLGRIGRQHETAGPVAFLISDAASYVTGQALNIDGGWTAW